MICSTQLTINFECLWLVHYNFFLSTTETFDQIEIIQNHGWLTSSQFSAEQIHSQWHGKDKESFPNSP